MPFTLNGIGTHYYGAGNRSARVDTCSQCHRPTTLSSYDTREWICVVYIPIIPLKKFRILDDCSSCRKHLRVPFAEFTQRVSTQVAPLRDAVTRAPRDPKAWLDLIHALIGWELRGEAQKEVDAAIALFPGDAAIHVVAGQLATDRSDLKAALPLYERAQSFDPQSGVAVYGYAWVLHQLGRDEEAVPVLQRTVAQTYNQSGALYLLGTSYMRLARWNEALQAYQQLLALKPQYVSDKKFMRRIAECKRKLGYELTDAERKAGRSWWPFGKNKPTRPKLQAGPTMVRPSLKIAGIVLLVIAALSLGFVGWDRYANTKVYFDNGLTRAMDLDVDNGHDALGAGAHVVKELKRGTHTVVIRESDGSKELERMTLDLEPGSFFDSIFHERFYVYNVAGMHVYRRSKHGYAVKAENSTYEEQILGPERFFEQRDVDYAFEDAPQTIEMDGNFTTKVAFNPATEIPLARYAIMRFSDGKPDEAKTIMARAVASSPCEVAVRRTEVYLASMVESQDAAAARAHQWISDCAGDNLEAHRAYQDLNTGRGHQGAMREEYRAQLDAAPDSAQAHYLFGRVAADPQVALAEHSAAIRLDPKMIWPHVARGHVLSEEEQYDEALREFSAALDLPGRDPAIAVYYASAAIAKGTPEVAVEKVEQVQAANAKAPGVLAARWMLAAAAKDWERAALVQKDLAELEEPRDAWWRKLSLLRMQGADVVVGNEIESAAREKGMAVIVERARIENALAKGDYLAADSAIENGGSVMDPLALAMDQAYAAGGFLITGDTFRAAKLLSHAEAALAANKDALDYRFVNAVVSGVRGTMPVEDVMAIMRESDVTQHAWFVAGVRAAVAKDRARAADCLARAVRQSSDLEFPYLELKRMASLF